MAGCIDDIISESRKADTEVVKIGAREFVVRVPKTAGEIISLEKVIGAQVKALENGKVTPEQKAQLPQPADVLRLACWVSHLCIDPKVQLADALRLAKEAGAWFLQFSGQVMSVIGIAAEDRAEEAVETEGEDSGEAGGSSNGPSQPETFTDGPLKS